MFCGLFGHIGLIETSGTMRHSSGEHDKDFVFDISKKISFLVSKARVTDHN